MEHSAGKAPRMKQRIALLGSTGSIGVQTLDIVRIARAIDYATAVQ